MSLYCDDIWDETPSTYNSSASSTQEGCTGYSDNTNRNSDSSGWRNSSSYRQGTRRTDSRGRGKNSYNTNWNSSWNGEKNDGSGRSKNDYWQHDNRSDSRQGRNFHQNDRGSNDRIQSREFTNSSRQFNSKDSRTRYGDRKSVNDLQGSFSTLTIRSSDVGKIIGKGGTKIRELQDESGARINVQQNDDNQPETTVELRGSEEVQKKAKELIEEFLANFTDKSRSNGPRNWVSNSDSTGMSGSKENSKVRSDEPIDWQAVIRECDRLTQERLAALPPIKKDFYFESPEVSNMSTKEVAEFRLRSNNMTVSKLSDDDRKIPNPVTTFEQAFDHYPEILEEIGKQKFKEPSPIQCQAWPILLQGYDMIGIAQTGTGKTIAFLLPAMIHIDNQAVPRSERPGPSCLILAPTRELAQQIEQEARKYQYRGIKCVCLYGGGSRRDQINVVTKGVEIVIATPGRLNDLVMNKIVDITGVTYLVLDEADRMLDMGFEPQIKKILLDIRPDKQTIMTSATWPEGVRRLADKYMEKPFQVCIGTLDLTAVHSVTQRIVMTSDEERREMLYDFLQSMEPNDKVIVFVDKKSVCDDLSSDLILDGIECQSLHGDREQCDREQALDDLKTGRARILIATDVASRGLDVKDITHIFNYNFPRNVEEYVHRVGRTGRAGRTGESITLFTRNDWRQAEELIKILQEANQEVPDDLYDMAERYQAWKQKKDAEDAAYGGRFRSGRRGRGRR